MQFRKVGETVEHAKRADLPLEPVTGSPRRSEYLTFCHEQAAAVKDFRVIAENRAAAAAYQSISPGPPVPQSRSFLGTHV
jgi:hypothetical protein